MPLLHDATIVALAERFIAGGVIASVIAWIGYKARALTRNGLLAAIIVGTLTFSFGGALVAAAVIIFFIAGSALSRVHTAGADRARDLAPKGGQRDAVQVWANGGVATACAVVGGVGLLHTWPHASSFIIAAVCAIAAASGDTWSTEIGALAHGPARLVTSMKRVDAGTSGGVTLLGTVAAPIGGALVGLSGALRTDILILPAWIATCAISGLVASLVDSLLGATMQAMWQCSQCGRVVEAREHRGCGAQSRLVRGVSWLDNDGVNGVMTLVGAASGYFLSRILT